METPKQPDTTLMDEIFAMIMKEAESRQGVDLLRNINSVYIEIGNWIFRTMDYIKDRESSKLAHAQVEDIKTTRLTFTRRKL